MKIFVKKFQDIIVKLFMKTKSYLTGQTLFILIISFIILWLSIFHHYHILVEYFTFLDEDDKPVLVTISIIFPFVFILLDRKRYKINLQEKKRIFQITVHTVQDLLQNSSSRLQNLILDLEEHNIDEAIVRSGKECLYENTKILKVLSEIDEENVSKKYDNYFSTFISKGSNKV